MFGLAVAGAALTAPVQARHLKADLVAETTGAAPGSTVWVALWQDIDKGWHTYWRNPGDAGEPTRIAWTLPRGGRRATSSGPRPGGSRSAKRPKPWCTTCPEGRR